MPASVRSSLSDYVPGSASKVVNLTSLGAQEGDVLLANLVFNSHGTVPSEVSMTLPGFTPAHAVSFANGASFAVAQLVQFLVCGASPPASVTVPANPTHATNSSALTIHCLQDADPDNPILQAVTDAGTGSTRPNPPNLVGPVPGNALIYVCGGTTHDSENGIVTPGTGMNTSAPAFRRAFFEWVLNYNNPQAVATTMTALGVTSIGTFNGGTIGVAGLLSWSAVSCAIKARPAPGAGNFFAFF